MIPFQERKKVRRILYSKVSLVVLVVILFFVSKGAWGIYQKAKIARGERDMATRSLHDLESRTAELQTSLVNMKSERGTEEAIRQKYTVGRPGEEVVVVVDDEAKKGKNSGANEKKSIWHEILSFFNN